MSLTEEKKAIGTKAASPRKIRNRAAIELVRAGWPVADIAAAVPISRSTIYRLIEEGRPREKARP